MFNKCSTPDRKIDNEFYTQFDVICKKLMGYLKTTQMTKDMMMVSMRKFIMILDFTMDKICSGDKCDSLKMRETCMQLKNIKMKIKRCLDHEMFGSVYHMRSDFCDCILSYYASMEKMIMCTDCCVGFDMIFKEICMRFIDFCEKICGKTCMVETSTKAPDASFYKDLMTDMHMWLMRFMDLCKGTKMTKNMMMFCIRKFITVVDFTMQKLCFGGKCHNVMINVICTELKHIKMLLEISLTYDVPQMKSECISCCEMFFKCIQKLMSCDDCCVDFDLITKDICTSFINFCKMMFDRIDSDMNKDVTTESYSNSEELRLPMHMRLMMKKLMVLYENENLPKDMLMMYIRKFMMIIDDTMEMLCFGDKCKSSMMGEICMELKNCQIVLERCLNRKMLTDVNKIRMECSACIKMFFKCMEKWMMCDDCCDGSEIMLNKIVMRFEDLFHVNKMNHMDYWYRTTMIHIPYVFRTYMKY
ncbi:hypothetical protein RN001_011244 [Aquatica leii]|uniref:Uncharacterized protein n=1 Tax=Aquatica leii TaxID=1421715 RepID=A0AAN7P8W8_9COLE|nr:hypothetical protein RN001_011244 [Aquatica leii]